LYFIFISYLYLFIYLLNNFIVEYAYFPIEQKQEKQNVWDLSSETSTSGASTTKKLHNKDDDSHLSGFIVTASIDQQVSVWRVDGKYVGTFGPFGWDINDEKTWVKRVNLDKNENDGKMKLLPKPPVSMKSSGIFKKKSNLIRKSVSIGDDNKRPVGKPIAPSSSNYKPKKTHTSDELNDYVDKLTEKISIRPPTSCAFNEQIGGVMNRHPIVS
jgi:hypothetical protein